MTRTARTFRIKVDGKILPEAVASNSPWAEVGREVARRLGVNADTVQVEVDKKVGFVRCTI